MLLATVTVKEEEDELLVLFASAPPLGDAVVALKVCAPAVTVLAGSVTFAVALVAKEPVQE